MLHFQMCNISHLLELVQYWRKDQHLQLGYYCEDSSWKRACCQTTEQNGSRQVDCFAIWIVLSHYPRKNDLCCFGCV